MIKLLIQFPIRFDLLRSNYRMALCISQFCLFSLHAAAQQDPLLSQYMFNRITINPGYVGSSNTLSSTLGYRQQFAGMQGNPKTMLFSIHAPIKGQSMGLGLKAFRETIGVTNQNSVSVVYAYHLNFIKGKLALGLEGGIFNQSIDFSNLRRTVQDDNALPLGKESILVPDAAFGVYYYSEKLYLGGALNHLLQNKLNYSGYTENDRTIITKLSSHAYFTGGYTFKAGESINVEPSMLLKYVAGAPLQIDINVNLTFKKMITIGSTYRTSDAIVFLFQYSFKNRLKIGYSYDYSFSDLAAYTNGSHGITLGINMAPKDKTSEIEETDDIIATTSPADSTLAIKPDNSIIVEKSIESKEELPENTLVDEPENADNIVFKVQIRSSDESIYRTPTNFNGLENVKEYHLDEGLYLYMVGSTDYYDYANSVLLTQVRSHGYKDAFIVAFREGKQISIDEALMLLELTKMPDNVVSLGPDKLKGQVTSSKGEVMQGVSVKLFAGLDLVEEVITSEKGMYSFDTSPDIDYSLYVTKKGYFDRFTTIKEGKTNGVITKNMVMSKK